MFDAFLQVRSEKYGGPVIAFDLLADSDTYVDGKTRADGTRSFLVTDLAELLERR